MTEAFISGDIDQSHTDNSPISSPSLTCPFPRISSIPSTASFADSVAQHLLQTLGTQDFQLADCLILTPSRRANRTLTDAFLRQSAGKPLILPHMIPLGDMDEEPLALSHVGNDSRIPASIASTHRILSLARLVMAASPTLIGMDTKAGLAQAIPMAAELAKLLDTIHIEQKDFADLQDLAPDHLAVHWQLITDFLKIITEYWPQVLSSLGKIDSSDRRNRLLTAYAEFWQSSPPETPVLVMGSTGSMPATRALMKVVLTLPKGGIVLPAFDTDMTDPDWQAITPSHPQYGLKILLESLEIDRYKVENWPDLVGDISKSRQYLIREVMRPATTTYHWPELRHSQNHSSIHEGLQGITMLGCQSVQDEAITISLIMREVLEHPHKTCALVTPDRTLALKVKQEMLRWNVGIDDSAGGPVLQTSLCKLFLLLPEVSLKNWQAENLLSLLRHPLWPNGDSTEKSAITHLDKILLRAKPSSLLENVSLDTGNLSFDDLAIIPPLQRWVLYLDLIAAPDAHSAVFALLSRVSAIYKPWQDFIAQTQNTAGGTPLFDWLQAHLGLLERLNSDWPNFWKGEAGAKLSEILDELGVHSGDIPIQDGHDYIGVLTEILRPISIHAEPHRHPRLQILGALEARIQKVDCMILGGLNEGTWPQDTAHDPWMSRDMREKLGLPDLMRSIGQSAHDVAVALGNREVFLTRSTRKDLSPTTPSRWWQRLEAVIKASYNTGQEADRLLKNLSGKHWHDYAKQLPIGKNSENVIIKNHLPPSFSPPIQSRPVTFSPSGFKKLAFSPYIYYANYILKIRPLNDLDCDPDASDKGLLVHTCLEIANGDKATPLGSFGHTEGMERLSTIAAQQMNRFRHWPEVLQFWQPALEAAFKGVLEHEQALYKQGRRIITFEAKGGIQYSLLGTPPSANAPTNIHLNARADRIDRDALGKYHIVDYKTGKGIENVSEMINKDPQLLIEALILSHGGFALENSDVLEIGSLEIWSLSRPKEPFVYKQFYGDMVEDSKEPTLLENMEKLEEILQYYLQLYLWQNSPYSVENSNTGNFDTKDYAHFLRIQEWQAA